MTKSGDDGSARPRRGKSHLLKDVKVIFHGLRHRQDHEMVARVPSAFMEDDSGPNSDLAAQYREMRRYDPNWGANNVNMQSLGYVGELGLKSNDGFYVDDGQSLGTKDTGTVNKKKKSSSSSSSSSSGSSSAASSSTAGNGVPEAGQITNLREYWAWFEAQNYFDYSLALDSLALPALLKTEAERSTSIPSNSNAKGGAKQQQQNQQQQKQQQQKQQKGNVLADRKRPYSDDELNESRLVDSLYSDTRGLAKNKDGIAVSGNSRSLGNRASLGDGAGDSKLYQRLVSAFVIGRRGGEQDTTFKPSILQNLRNSGKVGASVKSEKAEVVDVSDIPLERRAILEIGAAGLLREGDNGGDWTSLCREMMDRDSELSREIKARLKAEKKTHERVNKLIGDARSKYARELVEQKERNTSKEKQQIANYMKRL